MRRLLALCAAIALLQTPAFAQNSPAVNTALGCTVGQLLGNVSGSVGCANAGTIALSAKTVAINSTGDKATLTVPAGVTKYAVQSVYYTNCSGTPVLAQSSVWTGAAGTGTNIIGVALMTGASAATTIVSPTVLTATTTLTAGTLYVNVGVANAGAVTCDFYVTILNLT